MTIPLAQVPTARRVAREANGKIRAMGTDGVGNFENDTAADWIGEIAAGGRVDDVREALERVAHAAGDIDAPHACEALAAAEIVAAVRGYPGDTQVTRAVARRMPTLIEDAPLALAAIAAVVDPKNSELYWLWEGPYLAEWLAVVEDLQRRLGG